MAHAHATEFRNTQLWGCQHVRREDSVHRLCMQCQCIGPIPFHQQETHQMIEQLSSKHHRHSSIHEAVPAVSLADDKTGLSMTKWYRQFKCHDLDFAL
jgi:hypothetical protein